MSVFKVEIIDGAPDPLGSAQQVPDDMPGKWAEYKAYKGSYDSVTQELKKVYDSDKNVVTQIVVDREESEKNAIKLEMTRIKRNQLLDESDWTQLPDVYHSAGKKKEWEDYRQALRDITKDLANITWPEKPT